MVGKAAVPLGRGLGCQVQGPRGSTLFIVRSGVSSSLSEKIGGKTLRDREDRCERIRSCSELDTLG